MPRYIDADALKDSLIERYCDICKGACCALCRAGYIFQEIKSAPAADVELVRHGHYIGTEFDGYADGNPVYYEWKCSECDCVFEDDEPKYRYCPNCGAKMDKEEDDV